MILHGPIHTLLPRFFMAEDDAGGGGGDSGAPTTTIMEGEPPPEVTPATTSEQERVEGEVKPDFGSLKTPKKEPPKPPEEGKATQKEEKRATEAPDAKAEPRKEEPKAPEQPKTEKKAETKPKTEEKPKTEKVEAKKEEKKAAEPVKKAEIPDDDKDLDAIQSHADAPPAVVQSIKGMKGLVKETREAARAAKAEAKALQAEIATLKEQAGKLSPEVQAKIAEADKHLMIFKGQQSEVFQKQFVEPIKKSEEALYAWLKERQASDELIAKIKEAGPDKYHWGEIFKTLEEANPLVKRHLEKLLDARESAIAIKDGKLAELETNQEALIKEISEREYEERLNWAREVEKESIKLAAKKDWLLKMEVDADASEEEKKENEARNKKIDGHAEAFKENVRESYDRNPIRISDISLKAVEVDMLREQNEELTHEAELSKARVKELEEQLARIKNAGRITHQDATVITDSTKKPEETGKIGGDGREAISRFFRK